MSIPTWPEYSLLQAEKAEIRPDDPVGREAMEDLPDGTVLFRAETMIHDRKAEAALVMRPEALQDPSFNVEMFVREQLGRELAKLAK